MYTNIYTINNIYVQYYKCEIVLKVTAEIAKTDRSVVKRARVKSMTTE